MAEKRRARWPFVVLALILLLGVSAVGFFKYFPLGYVEIIKEKSAKYGLAPELVCAVIRTESRFNKDAVSKKGASGLMQIIETTGDWASTNIELEDYNYGKIFEPEINIEIGCWYMGKLLEQYGGNKNTALAAYNAGSGNVSSWLSDSKYSSDGYNLSDIPFGETKRYVARINDYEPIYKKLLEFNDKFPFIEKFSDLINLN